MPIKMEIDGLKQMLSFPSMVLEDFDKVKRDALEKAAAMMEAEVRQRVPKRTGHLESEITTTKAKFGRDGSASIQIGVKKDKGAAYAVPVEWGHVNPDGSVTLPVAFMGSTYEERREDAYNIMKEYFRDVLKERGMI